VRALLARYLTDHGFNVAQTSNVVDGMQSLTVEYDLLFTDISLQEGIGAELVRAGRLRWPTMQIIGLVQQTEGELLIETLNAGVDRYLVTPLDLPKVRQHITELLARRDRLVASVLESRQLTLEFQARTTEAVNALRQTEEEYRAIVRTVHEVIFRTDLHGVFTFLNDAWQEVTGNAAEASVGRAAADFVHAEDRAEFAEALRAVVGGERDNVRGELRINNTRGQTRWLELRARRLFDAHSNLSGVTGTLEDITAHKQAQEALRRSEAASRGLLAALPDAVLRLSRNGLVLGQEGAAVGWDRPQPVAGETVEQVFPAPEANVIRELIDRAFITNEVQVHEYQVAVGEQVIEFEVRLAATSDDAVVAIIRNITDRKSLEEQLRQSQKLEAIGRLAGGLAHDFNNLLTVVQGNAHLLDDEMNGNDVALDYLRQISVAAERGATLVRQLLAFGRRQVMQPTVLNLNSLVERTRSMLSRLIGEHIMLEVDLDPELGLIKADPGQVEQILVNLAVNARDEMGKGGVLRISTRNGAMALHGATGGGDPEDVVLLTITDDGPGMDAATLERVFEPFFTTKGLAHASGLGLATVYGIVQQSGGTISVLSEPGQGTSFEIALPRLAS
jgi:PAS domain S-box-containing protein